MRKKKIALVHDYLREYGGAERVLEALHDLYPDAPVYVGFVDQEAMGIHWSKFATWDLRQTWLSQIPLTKKLYSPLRLFAPEAFAALDLSAYDVVISSSNAYFAKAVQVPHGKHICYCHTPPRALYGYSTMTDWKKHPLINLIGTLLNHYLRVIDFQLAQQVDVFIANSQEVKRRIAKFYRVSAVVINPPVLVPAKIESKHDGQYYLYVNRLAFAKHPELAVSACTKLGLPLKVVGAGAMLAELKKLAGPTVEFVGAVSDHDLAKLYQHAKALLYPVADEDFGIVPVEAMGYGVPVLAHRSGGPQETIIEGKTGLFFADLTVDSLINVIKAEQKITWDRKAIHRQATKFSQSVFAQKITQLVESLD